MKRQAIQSISFLVLPVTMSVFASLAQSQHQGHMVLNDERMRPVQVISASGVKEWEGSYTPFGDVDVEVDTLGIGKSFGFAGQWFDEESGFYYNYYRDYDPSLGRYIQSDPIGLLGGLNTYSYVRSNPVNYIDPLGLRDMNSGYPYPPNGNSGGLSVDIGGSRFSWDSKTNNLTYNTLFPGSFSIDIWGCQPHDKKEPQQCDAKDNGPSLDETGLEYSPTLLKVITVGGNKDSACASLGFGINLGVEGNIVGPPIPLNY